MNLSYEGLSLWYGTPDAPAPLGELASREGTSLVVGARPANPTNAVTVRFRVDGGVVQTVPGRELRTDFARDAQYFVVTFPPFLTGETVEYSPLLRCGGRQAPAPHAAVRFPSRFLLPRRVAASSAPRVQPSPEVGRRYDPGWTYLATVSVSFDEPQFIGETPEGVRIDYIALGGTVAGPKLNGKVLRGATDHLFIRPDGIGVIRVRAVIASDDGARFEVEYIGTLELGEDGYRKALAQDLPSTPTMIICPRILTGHAKYRWLNRAQCLGIGKVDVKGLNLAYDLFAVTLRAHDATRFAESLEP
ncbi:MAG: DUF3237 domain-containing protein [Myxococcota bacterium]|nr:DUF3237 domain-containing protein [Myxococcota bacterium]